MSTSELEILGERLSQMVLSADCAIKNCKFIAIRLASEEASLTTVQEKTYFLNNPYTSTLSFTSNLYFHEALLVTGSILERGGISKETSIARYLQMSSAGSTALQQLIEQFDGQRFREIRNTRVAHKDANVNSGGHDLYFTTYRLEYISNLEVLISNIRTALMNDVGITVYANNYLSQRMDQGVKEMVDHLIEKYRSTPNRLANMNNNRIAS